MLRKIFASIRRTIIKHKEDVERCNSCTGRHAVGNHGPCETCQDGSNYEDVSEVFCATYNEKCPFGMNCSYCEQERKRLKEARGE